MSNDLAEAKVIEVSKRIGSNILAAFGDDSDVGSHAVQWSKSFAKSAHSSKNGQNSVGQGDPPKVSLTLGIAQSLYMMAHFSAMSP